MRTPKLAIIAVVSALSLFAVMEAKSQIIYKEDFNYIEPATGNLAVKAIGWSFYIGSGATDASDKNDSTDSYAAIAGGAGNPNTSKGALFVQKRVAGARDFAAVNAFSAGLDVKSGSSISWTMGNTAKEIKLSLMIQVGGDGTVGSGHWYVSTAQWANQTTYGTIADFAAATTASVTFSMNFTTSGSAWKELTLVPGSSMAVGNTLTSDLGGDGSVKISGIGFYIMTPDAIGVTRLDTLTITTAAVPEPTMTILLLGVGAVLLGHSAVNKKSVKQ